jgi:hypothetical protein
MNKDNKNSEVNDTDKKLHISDVIKRIQSLKIQYHECYGKYIQTQNTVYLERCEYIEGIFKELDIEYVL